MFYAPSDASGIHGMQCEFIHSTLLWRNEAARCKDGGMAGRTKGVRHTCPEPLKGRGEARYFAPKGTQGKEGVRRKSKADGERPEHKTGSPRSARQREREWDTVTVTVNGVVDGERYEGRVVQTVHESNQKCVSNSKYKAL